MKSSIKKLFAMCAAVSAITAVTAMSASAAGEITAKPNAGGDAVTVKQVSGTAVAGETTILLLKGDYTAGTNATVSDDDILYINQDDASTAKATGGFLADDGVLPKETLVENQVYTVKVADASGGFIYQTTFTLGDEPDSNYQLGDVTEDGYVDLDDAIEILKYDASMSNLTWDAERKLLGDVTKDTYVDLDDAILLLKVDAGLVPAPTWD